MIKYSYFKVTVPGRKRNGYIALAIERPGKDNPDQTHHASFAFCSPLEKTFIKSMGREIAERHLSANERKVSVKISGTLEEISRKLLNLAIDQHIVPAWVRKAYRHNGISYGRVEAEETLESKITQAINCFNAEHASNTPDFLLAKYIIGCLDTFANTVNAREKWYGREPRQTESPKN